MLISHSDPFEVAFCRAAKWFLWYLGLWPLKHIKPLSAFIVALNLSLLLLIMVGEFRFIWLQRGNPVEMLAVFCPTLAKLVTWLKLIGFIIYRREIVNLMDELFAHLKEDTEVSEKKVMIGKVSFFATACSIFFHFFSNSTNLTYAAKPIITWAYQRFTGVNDTWVSLPFQIALPYEDMTQLGNKGLYTLLFCVSFQAGYVSVFANSIVDCMFLYCCLYASVSLQCLQHDFQMTFKSTHVSTPNGCNSNVLYVELSRLVKRQQTVISMCNRFTTAYNQIVFMDFLLASITLGIIFFELILAPGMAKIIFGVFAIGLGAQMYFYCYAVEHLDENCMKLSDTLYFCEWYSCETRVKRLILFVMMKSQRKGLFRVPFFSPSLPLFSAIIRTSGSYITLMKTFV